MPPSANEIAARALETAQAAKHAAELATMAAQAAKETAVSMVMEMRQRFDRQDTESKQFREALMKEIVGQNRTFDAFKSDFEDEMGNIDRRCIGHNDALFGNPEKRIDGIVPKVMHHDNWISRLVWTWGVVLALGSGFIWYVSYFYGDAMKRGVFNPPDSEWRWRISKEIHKQVKPDSLYPAAPTPDPN